MKNLNNEEKTSFPLVGLHADDYGYTVNTSKDIIECIMNRSLDSFSIISNMPCFIDCVELLYNEIPNFSYLPLMSVHLNLVEGFGYDGSLLNEKTWGYYFLSSFSIGREKLKTDIKKNIKYQIDKTWTVIQKCFEIAKNNNINVLQENLRIDSHVHTHLIPIVWESLTEVIEENNYKVEYIRNSKEPLLPFVGKKELFSTYSLINFVKNRILMLLSKRVDNYCEKKNLQKSYLCGLMFSGKMDEERLNIIYPELKSIAEDKGRYLEILFHPGQALISEENEAVIKEAYANFNSSVNRNIEKRSVLNFKK